MGRLSTLLNFENATRAALTTHFWDSNLSVAAAPRYWDSKLQERFGTLSTTVLEGVEWVTICLLVAGAVWLAVAYIGAM
jgi:hypothetical protein